MSIRVSVYDDATWTEAYNFVIKHEHCAIALVTPHLSLPFHFFGDSQPTGVRVWRRRGGPCNGGGKWQPQDCGEETSATPGDSAHGWVLGE
jgi:hypothetical protein